MQGQGGGGFSGDTSAEELRLEVDRALAAANVAPADAIWGPTAASFRFGALSGSRLRDVGPLEWMQRVLNLHFFMNHDNRPSTREEIESWTATMTPNDILAALTFAIEVGLP